MTFNKLLFYVFIALYISFSGEIEPLPVQKTKSKLAKKIAKDELDLHPNEGLFYYQKKPFPGIAVEYDQEGVKLESIDFRAGKKEGWHRKWFANGQLGFEAKNIKGRLTGIAKTWWPNGMLRSESRYLNGVVHGVQKQWYKSGQLFKERNLRNGKEDGLQKAWRKNGKIYNNYEARNGRFFGLKRSNLCYELQDEIIQFNNN